MNTKTFQSLTGQTFLLLNVAHQVGEMISTKICAVTLRKCSNILIYVSPIIKRNIPPVSLA